MSLLLAAPAFIRAQNVPPSASKPWNGLASSSLLRLNEQARTGELHLQEDRTYRLPELIDLAETYNPETKAAWQAAKQQAALLKVGRSDLFPTLAALALGETLQTGVLLYNQFVLQNEGVLEGEFTLNYTILDFGARQDRIARQRSDLLAANFGFNDTHRRIIFEAMNSYYQLLNANGQHRAAEINLQNAKTVQEAAEARLQHGLATLPDVLEARSLAAQAEYELQSTVGLQEAASGDLATVLTASPSSRFQIQDIDALTIPDSLPSSTDNLIGKAFTQRPDLLARLSNIEGAQADIRGARSAYYPDLSFDGNWGRLRVFGEQPPYGGTYATANAYDAQLRLRWTIFDGGRRRGNLEAAKAAEKRAEAEASSSRDQIADEVWRSYSDAKTALKQRESARIFLDASNTSFQAALESYNYGVRSVLDVLSSQRTLAQARSADIAARARVLTAFADLSYRTGDILRVGLQAKP